MANPPAGDKKNIVKLAYLYFQEGRWDNAIEEYQKLLELDPEDMNIHNMLGDVYVKKNAAAQAYNEYSRVAADLVNRGQMDKAVLIHRKIARLDSAQLSADARQKQSLIQLHMKADQSLEENKVEEAIEAFSEILKLNPEDLIVASKLAELDEKVGRVTDAVQQYLTLGDSFMKSHLFKKAQEMYKKVTLMDPANETAHMNLAQIYLKQGSENDAKKEYLSVAEQALAKGDLETAQANAAKAVELKSIEAHYIVGVVLCRKEKWAEAKTEFDDLLRFKVNHLGALVYLGKVFAAQNQMDKAAESFQKALKVDKDSPLALEGWADFNIARKNKPEALKALNQLVDKGLAGNDAEAAVNWAQKLVSVDVALTESRVKLAQALEKKGDANAAADAYYSLAIAMSAENKTADAENYLKKTLELNPSHEKAIAGQAQPAPAPVEAPPPVIEVPEEKQVETVHASQAEVGNVSPQEAFKAQVAVADQYVKQGLLDEAIEIYQQLLDVEPDNTEVKGKLNKVYSALAKTGTDLSGVFATPKSEEAPKKTAEAPKAVEDGAKKNLKELEAKAREEADKRARIELEKRAREEADKRANEEIKRLAEEKEKKAQAAASVGKVDKGSMAGMDDMVAMAEADLLHSQGKTEEALKIYKNILAAHPDNPSARKKLDSIEENLKAKAPSAAPKAVPPVLKVVEKPSSGEAGQPASNPENDSNIKKKSNKIGYV